MCLNSKKYQLLAVGILLLLAVSAVAQESEQPQTGLEPPPLPPKVRSEEEPPVVSIRTEEDKTIEEYRQNGRVYMVKVTPREGISYYYMDLDGDGELELQPGENGLNPVAPVMWKLFEW